MRRIAAALYLLALMVFAVGGVRLVPFHGDEATLIYGSRDYFDQFVERDLPRVMNLRDDDDMDQQLRLLDGRVQTYLGGFAYHLTGGTAAGLNQPWLWGAPAQFNIDDGHVPSDDLLMTQRSAMALLLALSILAAYGVGAHLGGVWGGLLMATLVALSPNTLINGRRVMMEAPLLLFSLLTVLAALRIASSSQQTANGEQPTADGSQQPENSERTDAASAQLKAGRWTLEALRWLLFGLGAGMALSSKHPAVYTLVPLFGALGLWTLWRRDWRRLAWLVGMGVLALGIYLVMNPAWWVSPAGTLSRMLHMRADLLAIQREAFGGYTDFGGNIRGFIEYAVLETPQYAEVDYWEEVGTTIAEYEASPWAPSLLVNTLRAIVTVVLAAWGAWVLARRRDTVAWVAGVWIAFTLVTVFVLTPLPWARYYLPALPALYALAAVGIGSIRYTGRPRR